MDAITKLAKEIAKLWRAVRKLQITGFQRPTWLTTPLTSASWDGDGYSTTASTVIDLSAVFGVPANVKAILVTVYIQDSGGSGTQCYFSLSSSANASAWHCQRFDNIWARFAGCVVPCDANGDVYYQVVASGALTLDVVIQIWGYFL